MFSDHTYNKFFDWRGAMGSYEAPKPGRGSFRLPDYSLKQSTINSRQTNDQFHKIDARDYFPEGGAYRANPYGLSNVPKVTALEPIVGISSYPSRTIVRMRFPKSGYDVKSQTRNIAVRKRITKFSDKSRINLQEMAYDMSVLYKSELMLTLTYPAEWQSVTTPKKECTCGAGQGSSDVGACICPDPLPSGKFVKHHLSLFRKRLIRYFKKQGSEISALWFLEFQKRGAPHFHMILWSSDGLSLTKYDLEPMRDWVRYAWAEIVDHKNPIERKKHENAGTRVEFMKKPTFGYASKYASKMEQKNVPPEFRDVGRFWGLFGCSRPSPVESVQTMSPDELWDIVGRLNDVLKNFPTWQMSVQNFYEAFLLGSRFTLKAYSPLVT